MIKMIYPGISVSSTNKTHHQYITEKVLKLALRTIHQNNQTDSAVRCKSNYHAITTTTAQDRNVNDIRYPFQIGIQSSTEASSSVNMVRVLIVQRMSYVYFALFSLLLHLHAKYGGTGY
jgi:hypothetical protein